MRLKGIEMKNHKTIAVDFDGTLSFGKYTEVGKTELIIPLKKKQ